MRELMARRGTLGWYSIALSGCGYFARNTGSPAQRGPLPSGHGMVGLHPGTACTMPYGLPGNARGLIYSEFDYHQTALESDLLPQTPNGKKSSGHFRQQAMLALLAA